MVIEKQRINLSYMVKMSLLSMVSNVGRFIGSTGRGALRKIGDTAKGIKTIAGKINDATGGAAGLAWNAVKAHPTFGKFAMGAEGALNAAIKGSDAGLKAIDLGQRATRVRDVAGAKSVYDDARGLARSLRP
jgi:hypothetical protein